MATGVEKTREIAFVAAWCHGLQAWVEADATCGNSSKKIGSKFIERQVNETNCVDAPRQERLEATRNG